MEKEESTGGNRSWLIPLAIAIIFVCWGLLVFFSVGDKKNPSWDFGVVEDIPGQSAYSTGQR